MPTDDSDLYRDLMRFKPAGISPNRWAMLAGVSRTVWSDMRRHGNPARRTLEKLLAAADSSLAEFEAMRIGARGRVEPRAAGVGEHSPGGWRGALPPPLPVFEARAAPSPEHPSRIAIAPRQSKETIARPPALSADRRAYALTVAEESMWPRFRLGRRLIVSPAARVADGDDVVVRLAGDGGLALIKMLVDRTAGGLRLRQFNPDLIFVLPLDAVDCIERIAGEAID